GAMPPDHPLNGYGAGNLGLLGPLRIGRPDAVLVLGARTGMFLGGRSGLVLPEDAALVQVDVDAAEIGRFLPVDVGITADSGEALAAFLADDDPWPDRQRWAEAATTVYRRESPFAAAETHVGGRLHPHHAAREVMRAMPPGSALVADGGEVLAWVGEVMHEAK